MAFRETLESTQQMQTCILNCTRCHEVCLKTSSASLDQHGDARKAVTTLLVCADLCRVCADTLIRNSSLHPILCRACAEVCARAAATCTDFQKDPLFKECAAACRDCFDSCTAMAARA